MSDKVNDILAGFYKALLNKNEEINFRDSVVAISRDGILREYFLDEMPYNHAKCTCYMALKLGIPYFETNLNMVAGEKVASYGIITLHIHKGGMCICFFPNSITFEQYSMLKRRLEGMNDFLFQYKESMQEEGFISIDNVLNYAFSIIDEKKKVDYFKVLNRKKD